MDSSTGNAGGTKGQRGPDPNQVEQALRFTLGTLLGVADKVKESEPLKRPADPGTQKANNVLDPNYRRPWWTIVAGLSGVALWYWLSGRKGDEVERRER